MQNRYEGFTQDMGTPVTRVLTRSMGRSVMGQMASSRAAAAAKTKALKEEAYRRGVLDILYAHQVQGMPLPGMEKLIASMPQAPQGPPGAPPMDPMGGMPPPPPMGQPMPPGPPQGPQPWQPPGQFLDPRMAMGGPGASQGLR